MKIYKTQQEIEADIKGGMLIVNEDVTFEISFKIGASIKINGNIRARDISARDIRAWNIRARDISAENISAWNIRARDISFFAVCFAYAEFVCKSIKGRRDNSKYFCLDSEVEIKENMKC